MWRGPGSAQNVLQWFVAEQLEEISSMVTLLRVVRRAGESGLLIVEAMFARKAPRKPLRAGMEWGSLCCVYNRCGSDIGDTLQAGERASRAPCQWDASTKTGGRYGPPVTRRTPDGYISMSPGL